MKKALRETQTLRTLAVVRFGHRQPARPLSQTHRPRPRPLGGRFEVPTQGGSVLYVCTKFEADRSFRSKVIRGPEISTLGHVTQATPILASFCFPYAGGMRRPSLYQI